MARFRDKMSTQKLFQKPKKGKPLNEDAKQIVLNTYEFLRKKEKNESISSIVKTVAELTGVSQPSVYRFRAEARDNGGKACAPRRNIFTPERRRKTRLECYNTHTKNTIQQIVHQFFFRSEQPTAAKVLQIVNEDPTLPTISLSTMKALMKDLGFKTSKPNRNAGVPEKEDLKRWSRNYHRAIRKYRAEGRKIIFPDETWAHSGQVESQFWQDSTGIPDRQPYFNNTPTENQVLGPPEKEGNESGFLPLDNYEVQKPDDYYHPPKTNGEYYPNWFSEKLLANLPPHSVIVVDPSYNAPKAEKVPNKASRKADIQAWLTSKGVAWEPDMIVKELLDLVADVKHQYDTYKIEKIAKDHGHIILRMPPYHSDLNAL